jgi:2,5-furandicarboxylate decarboxylase 1
MRADEKDLRSYISLLEQCAPDLIVRVKREIDLEYEGTAFVKMLGMKGRDPVVRFDQVKGYSHPIVCNLFASRRATALALGCAPKELNEIYLEGLCHPIRPEIVKDAPVKEVVNIGSEANLASLPVPKHHEQDAGPYISAGVCITPNRDGKTVNMGMYRLMVAGAQEGGIFINPNHHGGELLRQAELKNEPLEMAIVIGHHPALAIASQNNEPFGTDDYSLVGGLLKEPLQLVQAETLSFPVPSAAEIVIEGELVPGMRKDEGPFGEYTMNYGLQRKSPVFRVKAICHRRDYVFHDIIPASKEHVGLWIMPSKEGNLYKKLRAVFPTVKAVCMPLNGSGYHARVCIEKVRDGDGKNVLLTLLGSEYMVKHAIVVDDDIDVYNSDEVLWAISTRVQADQDVFIINGARSSVLDPSSHGLGSLFTGEGIVAKMGIDATRPITREFPKRANVPKEVWEKIDMEDYLSDVM